ncbi:hypothetical protein HDU67_008884, partial [Dinochytrium kinnereticum]
MSELSGGSIGDQPDAISLSTGQPTTTTTAAILTASSPIASSVADERSPRDPGSSETGAPALSHADSEGTVANVGSLGAHDHSGPLQGLPSDTERFPTRSGGAAQPRSMAGPSEEASFLVSKDADAMNSLAGREPPPFYSIQTAGLDTEKNIKMAHFLTPTKPIRQRRGHATNEDEDDADSVSDQDLAPLPNPLSSTTTRDPLRKRSNRSQNFTPQTTFGVSVVTPAHRSSTPTPGERGGFGDHDAIHPMTSPHGLLSPSKSVLVFDVEPVEDVEGGFSGWGSVVWIDDLWDEKTFLARLGATGDGEAGEGGDGKHGKKKEVEHAKIGQWTATAIAANDLMGSILYTIGVTTSAAGKFAPISLLLVCMSLFVFRKVIQEVGVTVPMNGGSYSAMMLFSNKVVAAIVACCTLLDYVATAVVSAASASAYASSELGRIDTFWVTIAILTFFSILTMFGVKESSKVSLGILLLHVVTIVVVAVTTLVQLFTTASRGSSGGFWETTLGRNLVAPSSSGSVAGDIFFGYCVGMVGVTGFEASINYVEEQLPGVFPKTLRNMCYLVLFCNPIMSILALSILPIQTIVANSDVVISLMAAAATTDTNMPEGYIRATARSSMGWLTTMVAVDAIMVIGGGVLTAYVGLCGLIEVMALDNILPPFLLYRPPRLKATLTRPTDDPNDLTLARYATDASLPATRAPKLPASPHFSTSASTKTRPLIPLSFLLLCVLLYAIVGGRTALLGLVFSMAFLSVLGSFVA